MSNDSKFRVQKDKSGEFYWVFIAKNDEIIARSTDGYVNRSDCLHSIRLIKDDSPTANVYDHTKDPLEIVKDLP